MYIVLIGIRQILLNSMVSNYIKTLIILLLYIRKLLNMAQKTVLVFGGSGIVGQGVIRALLENGDAIVLYAFFMMQSIYISLSLSRCGGLQERRIRSKGQAPPRKPSRKCTDDGDRGMGSVYTPPCQHTSISARDRFAAG